MDEEKWQRFVDALNEIDVESLTDDQLKSYYAMSNNDNLDCLIELRKRKIELF